MPNMNGVEFTLKFNEMKLPTKVIAMSEGVKFITTEEYLAIAKQKQIAPLCIVKDYNSARKYFIFNSKISSGIASSSALI